MSTCVYEHPLRRIIVSWEHDDDGVAVLTDYSDAPPSSDAPKNIDIRVVHSSSMAVHRYPTDEPSAERQTAELENFLPEASEDAYMIHAIPSVATNYNSKWVTLLGLPKTDDVTQVSDIEADMRAIALDGSALLLGRRGDLWWCGAVGDDGQALHLESVPHPAKQPLGLFLHEQVNELAFNNEPEVTSTSDLRRSGDTRHAQGSNEEPRWTC